MRNKTRINAIRKELAILIEEKHKTCNTQQEKNRAVSEARREMNIKYGPDWRHKFGDMNYD